MHSHIDFGYPWLLTYVHLILFGICAVFLVIATMRRWTKWLIIPVGALAFWSFTAFLVMRFEINLNGRGSLPTQAFLPDGGGRVLDLGAGTGRSTLMVLEARPQAKVVALDLFGKEFARHFGEDKTQDVGEAMLLANLRAAGVADRATVQAADMRKLPFDDASFDGIVSAYALDHLDHAGIRSTILESKRVLKPGGQFLLMIVANDPWLNYAYGPVLVHMHHVSKTFWSDSMLEAGFEVQEHGLRPATGYVLARKPGGASMKRDGSN